jgi:hypothetical protein
VPSAFENLCSLGKPRQAEASDAAELEGLQSSGLARLADAGKVSLALESRFGALIVRAQFGPGKGHCNRRV